MKQNIAAVLVTFNRKDLVTETIDSLLKQTHPLDIIYIIDNASTDETEQVIAPYLTNEKISYHRLNKNTGGAGGFHQGMLLAHQAGHDWIWTMDDDVAPRPNALSEMLKYTHISECINATKIFTKNDEVQYWEQYFDFATNRLIDLKNSSFANNKDWCSTNVACFEGMLVSKRVIEKIGYPDPSYFIYHDDTIYGIKASLWTNVIYVKSAIFDKKIYGYGSTTPLRAYYATRNSFKLKRDAFATNMLGEPSRKTNFLFLINTLSQVISMIKDKPNLSIMKSAIKGFFDGYKGK